MKFFGLMSIRKDFFVKILRTFCCILFMSLFFVTKVSAQAPNCELSVFKSKIDGKTIKYTVEMMFSEGWKPAKKPKIIRVHSENVKNFSYNDAGECAKISDHKYRIDFSLEKISDDKNFDADLEIRCPICRDICTIVTKHLRISDDEYGNFSRSQPLKDNFSKNFLLMLIFAFIGGLILNVMPCVLPVLLLKLRSFGYLGNNRNAVLGSLAGNYSVFCLLAISIFLLKKSGELVGWGMHFQSPIFLKFAAIVLFFMSLQASEIFNLSPSFEIKNENKKIFAKNFVSSFAAAFVALPCTAPFLGTAATFAIAEGTTTQFFLIFSAIATGFSVPYLMMSAVPKYLTEKLKCSSGRLQKFGNFFRQSVNFGVYVAFLWILWLLLRFYGSTFGMLIVLLFGISFMLFKKNFTAPALAAVFAILFIPYVASVKSSASSAAAQINLEEAIRRENFSKNVLILNISADWCMTCHYNKMMVLNDPDVQKMFRENNVKILESDLSEKNDDYMRFIRKYGRVGIPFTMVFGPAVPDGILLPEIFSKQQLYNAVKKARADTEDNF